MREKFRKRERKGRIWEEIKGKIVNEERGEERDKIREKGIER